MRQRPILFVGRGPRLSHAVEYAVGRHAQLVVHDSQLDRDCTRRPARGSLSLNRLAGEVAAHARDIGAELVSFSDDLPFTTMNGVRRIMRRSQCDHLVLSGPITTGSVVAAIAPAAGDETNARVLATALAHSHLFRCELHIVHASRVEGPDRRDQIAELVAPICKIDPARLHVVNGAPVETIGALARDVAAWLVVLGSSTRPQSDLLGRIVRQVLPSSSALVVQSTSGARRHSRCGADR